MKKSEMLEFACETCGTINKKRWYYSSPKPRFCSRRCVAASPELRKAIAETKQSPEYKAKRDKKRRKANYSTRMMITCVVCGKEAYKQITSGQSLPRYCSRKCFDNDIEFHKKRIKKTTKIRRTKESRAKTSRQAKRQMANPEFRERIANVLRKSNKARMGTDYQVPCACGCGEMITRNTGRKDKQAKFIRGHHTRTPEWQARQSKRMKKVAKNPEWRKRKTQEMLNAWNNGNFPQTYTKPFLFVIDILDQLTIPYEVEYTIGPYSCDIFLTEQQAVIEVHGDYWHANPRIYPDGPINDIQTNRLRVDASKAAYLANRNIPLLAIWEYDIKNNPKTISKMIQDFI